MIDNMSVVICCHHFRLMWYLCGLVYLFWTLTKRIEKKLDVYCTTMLLAILNKSWNQHTITLQLCDYMLPISQTTQVKRTKHAGLNGSCKDEFVSDISKLIPTHWTWQSWLLSKELIASTLYGLQMQPKTPLIFLRYKCCCHWYSFLKRSDGNNWALFLSLSNILIIVKMFYYVHVFKIIHVSLWVFYAHISVNS